MTEFWHLPRVRQGAENPGSYHRALFQGYMGLSEMTDVCARYTAVCESLPACLLLRVHDVTGTLATVHACIAYRYVPGMGLPYDTACRY